MEQAHVVVFALPQDQSILAALGAVTIRSGQLDYCLRMTICSITDIGRDAVFTATARQSSSALRDRVRKLAKRRFGESQTLLLLDALLSRARCATEKRNQMIHCLWAHEIDGDPVIADHDHKFSEAPSAADIEALASEIETITYDFIKARKEGFLCSAPGKPQAGN